MKKILLLTVLAIGFLSCKKKEQNNSNNISNDTISEIKKTEVEPYGYEIGDEANDFSLKNINDQMVSLADFSNAKGFIVIFTCNHCPYSKAYEDRIIKLNNKYADLGYPVIAINPNDPSVQPEDDFKEMKIRAKEKGFTFPYLFDAGQKVYPKYGATKTPHVFILNKENNKNIVKYIGTIDNNYEDANSVTEPYVEDAVNALLAGKEIQLPKTVAIGCSIKKKE